MYRFIITYIKKNPYLVEIPMESQLPTKTSTVFNRKKWFCTTLTSKVKKKEKEKTFELNMIVKDIAGDFFCKPLLWHCT